MGGGGGRGGINENIALDTTMTTDSITEDGTCIHDNGFKPNNLDTSEELHIPQDSRSFNDKRCPLDTMENSPEDILMNLKTLKREWCHNCPLEHKFPVQ